MISTFVIEYFDSACTDEMRRILLLDCRASIRALETADFDLLSHSALTNRKRSFSARIKMNFLFFGFFLVEFCSASKCRREKDRIKELSLQKRELRIERNELKKENEDLKRKLEAFEVKEEFEFFATKNSYFYVPVSKKRRKYEFTFSKRKF